MIKFTELSGVVAPLNRANVDTDLIIPKQFMKSIRRSGFGPNLFDELRYLNEGRPGEDCSARPLNPDFALNQARYHGAAILLARENFGCGSSREHAVWALNDYGIRCVIAPSYADIFFNNCFKNGVLPIVLNADLVDRLFDEVYATQGYRLHIDLQEQQIFSLQGEPIQFDVEPRRKHNLLGGIDEIGDTLQYSEAIRAFEQTWRQQSPWLFNTKERQQ
ncbi:MAG: 3-isopropylmalate dehydratase small subunit [Halieaceae bacterium]|nr:3-isopropylmalate dehydratase small subunit [Halieaceae bacterium]